MTWLFILFDFLNYRKLKRYAKKVEKELLIFTPITTDEKILKKAVKIKNKKYYEKSNLIVNEIVKSIEKHNNIINETEYKLKRIIENNDCDYIIEHIDEYSFEKINEFNNILLQVAEYKIETEEYLNYISSFSVIFDNYYEIVEQFSLIKKINVCELEDKYIDKKYANDFFSQKEELIKEFKKKKSLYYPCPVIDTEIIEKHNELFINNHIKDTLFNDINGKSLDYDQRKAVLCDSQANLVVAGAGSGKTLTICGKVRYLLENKMATSQEMLLLSYSAESAKDLQERISKIDDNITVKTFHALGLDILNRHFGEKKAIDEQFSHYIQKYFSEEIINHPEQIDRLIRFFGLFLYENETGTKQYQNKGEVYNELQSKDYKTLKDRLKELKNNDKGLSTLQDEIVKSYEELVIANFLYINGIKYEYERAYEIKTSSTLKRQYTPDFYLSDYGIYLEHYGINKEGRTPQYTKSEEIEYLLGMEWKRKIHKENETICIETYSYEFSDGTIFTALQKRLQEHGVELKPLNKDELKSVLESIEESQDNSSFVNLVKTFISLYKSRYSNSDGFSELKEKLKDFSYNNVRAIMFLQICQDAFEYYRACIDDQEKIDFDDMILKSITALDDTNYYKYKYIIVDEFQDISKSRMSFLQKLISHGNSKLFAVGDDWQAIYRFSGCDLSLFLNFQKIFDDAKLNFITSTHRNSMDLQQIVEPFITANPEQIVKHIYSEIRQNNPIRILYHNSNMYGALTSALSEIEKEDKNAKVLILARNRHDIDKAKNDNLRINNYTSLSHTAFPNMELSYKTVHQSKGLESKYVILISGENAKNGFPNQMEDDPVLDLVLEQKSQFPYAEERRLFYVALTRTKSCVYVLSDYNSPSQFIKEIDGYCQRKVDSSIHIRNVSGKYDCPICKSGQLVVRTSKEGRQFFGCSYYPYCKYTINDLDAVEKGNRCPFCGDFLVQKHGRNGVFYGCHNYPKCNYTKNVVDAKFKLPKIGF